MFSRDANRVQWHVDLATSHDCQKSVVLFVISFFLALTVAYLVTISSVTVGQSELTVLVFHILRKSALIQYASHLVYLAI